MKRSGFAVAALVLAIVAVLGHEAAAVLPSGNGQTTKAKSMSVAIASDQVVAVSGTISVDTSALATAAKQDTGNTSAATTATNTTTIAGRTPALGSTTMASASPVTIATNDTVAAAMQVALNLLTMPKQTTAVTPSDATDTTAYCNKGIWVGTAGDVAVKMLSDSAATTIKNVSSGTPVYGQFLRIMSTNTTATNIVCFGGTG